MERNRKLDFIQFIVDDSKVAERVEVHFFFSFPLDPLEIPLYVVATKKRKSDSNS